MNLLLSRLLYWAGCLGFEVMATAEDLCAPNWVFDLLCQRLSRVMHRSSELDIDQRLWLRVRDGETESQFEHRIYLRNSDPACLSWR